MRTPINPQRIVETHTRTLAHRFNLPTAYINSMARDLKLPMTYRPENKTWVLTNRSDARIMLDVLIDQAE